MSRTDIDPATLAKALRQMAGDGSIEWVMEPIQASVLLDVADALDENDKLRELASDLLQRLKAAESMADMSFTDARLINRCKELGVKEDE